MNSDLPASMLQFEILCSGAEDMKAAQNVLKIMYFCELEAETIEQQAGDSQLSLVQLLTNV